MLSYGNSVPPLSAISPLCNLSTNFGSSFHIIVRVEESNVSCMTTVVISILGSWSPMKINH
jgi:hypothetical protein